MAELLTKRVLFQGASEIDQIDKVFRILGSPTDEIWPGHKELDGVKKVGFYLRKNMSAILKAVCMPKDTNREVDAVAVKVQD